MRHRCIYTEKPFKHSLYYTACTKHFPVLLCTLYFPVLLCTTKLAESTSLYYFVLRSLHKACPSTTVYYKACTNHFPVFSLCYKACAKYIPVLLCTTKLAQSTSQYFFVLPSLRKVHPLYYFVLQSLHKAHPTNTLYYKAYTKHVPVLLCTTPSKNQSHTKTNGPHPPRTRGIPCIAGRSHFTRKKQGFVRRLPPQHKPHATFTQPLQFVLQQLVYTMLPLQCDLQPQIPKHPTATHTRRNKHCKTPSRNQSQTKMNGPHPPRTQGTFHRRPKPLYTKKHKVSCSGFLPKPKPMQHAYSH